MRATGGDYITMPKRKYYRKKKSKKTPLTRADIVRRVVVTLFLAAVLFTVGLFCYCAYRFTGTVLPTAELFDGQPTIRFVDVGQGDCTLVTFKGDSVMIDCGTVSSGAAAAENARMYAPVIDYLVITHPHEDHMGGAADVLSTVKVKNLVMSDITVQDGFYTEAVETAQRRGTNIIYLSATASFEVGEITVDILDAFDFEYTDINDASLVCRVTVAETTLLVTGDAEEGEESYLLENCREMLDCDILKVGHHGSRSSTTEEFLAAVSPETCVISVGRGNSYGHPTNEVLDRIEKSGAELHRTDLEGQVIVRGKSESNQGLLDIWRNMWYD